MQDLDIVLLMLANIILGAVLVGVILFVFCRRKNSNNGIPKDVHEYPNSDFELSDTESDGTDEAYRIVEWIRRERKKAQDSLDRGDLQKAGKQLSSLLEEVYRDAAKLAPIGPKNYSQIKSEIEFTLDETSARIILQDLRSTVESIDEFEKGEINIWDAETVKKQLDAISEEGNALADEAETIAIKSGRQLILQEIRLLRDELALKIDNARRRLRGKSE